MARFPVSVPAPSTPVRVKILESYKEAVVAQWPDPPDIPPRWIAAEKGDKVPRVSDCLIFTNRHTQALSLFGNHT